MQWKSKECSRKENPSLRLTFVFSEFPTEKKFHLATGALYDGCALMLLEKVNDPVSSIRLLKIMNVVGVVAKKALVIFFFDVIEDVSAYRVEIININVNVSK